VNMIKTALRGVEVPSLRNLRIQPVAPVFEMDGPYSIAETETGVRCGNHHREDRVRHANAASVRECYRLTAEMIADQEAEIRAEQGYERYLEDRGYWEARAQEDHEARMGIF
jgi:hypothetical protein